MHIARPVDLGLVAAQRVCMLLARQDVEVVVGRVAARVALGANCSAKDDEIFRNACGRVSVAM